MKKFEKIRYILLGMLLMAALSGAIIPALAAQTSKQQTAYFNNIRIVMDGETVTPRDVNGNIVEPFIVDGTTYLPIRAICEAIGYDVEWDGSTNTVYALSGSDNVDYVTDDGGNYGDKE